MSTLTIPARFRGPARSGNGGWSAGALAAYVDAATVRVRLHRPPPLDVPMTVDPLDGGGAGLRDGSETVLRATPYDGPLTPVAPVDAATARAAEGSFPGLTRHPFPGCFTCGTDRAPGDGLRILPGPVGPERAAATWRPGADVDRPITWAALDCAGAWAAGMAERPMVLGEFTVRVDHLPDAGEEHVVLGEHRGTEGRKVRTATSAYSSTGGLVGTAEATWLLVDPDAFN